jgi:chitin disaccharide deacetylase
VSRFLIVNADDLGQTPGINAGIAEAHERGVVTSASLMVRGAAAAEAAAWAARRPALSLGLHLDLGEWVCRAGEWEPAYSVVDTDDEAAVAAELDRQLEAFHRLTGRWPSHLDSHQHVHRDEPARRLVAAAGRRLGVPVRHLDPAVTYRGDFYGQTGKGDPYPGAITVEALLAVLGELPAGWTELGCHPGRDTRDLTYGAEREQELAVLCDPAVRAAVRREGVLLRGFHDAPRRGGTTHDPAPRAAATSTGGTP